MKKSISKDRKITVVESRHTSTASIQNSTDKTKKYSTTDKGDAAVKSNDITTACKKDTCVKINNLAEDRKSATELKIIDFLQNTANKKVSTENTQKTTGSAKETIRSIVILLKYFGSLSPWLCIS